MSPVDRAGPVSEISSTPISFEKNSMCSYKAGQPSYRDLGFYNWDENFLI